MNNLYQDVGGKSIRECLKKQHTVAQYIEFVNQILSMLIGVQGKGMTFSLELNKMQVQDGKICVSTRAEDSVYEVAYVKKFIKELTFATVFAGGEDCVPVTEFMHFLDDTPDSISLMEIQKFLNKTETAPAYGNTTQNPRLQEPEEETGVLDEAIWDRIQSSYQQDVEETGILDPSYWEKNIRSAPSAQIQRNTNFAPAYGKLINVKTGQQIIINKDTFWIGKEDVDLQIDKDVISRKHAVIMTKMNHYFVSDNGSTNKTYVDNKEIPPKASVEIFKGTRIKFANQEYEFQI